MEKHNLIVKLLQTQPRLLRLQVHARMPLPLLPDVHLCE
jgi:hypothetical protein